MLVVKKREEAKEVLNFDCYSEPLKKMLSVVAVVVVIGNIYSEKVEKVRFFEGKMTEEEQHSSAVKGMMMPMVRVVVVVVEES